MFEMGAEFGAEKVYHSFYMVDLAVLFNRYIYIIIPIFHRYYGIIGA